MATTKALFSMSFKECPVCFVYFIVVSLCDTSRIEQDGLKIQTAVKEIDHLSV